MSPLMLPNMFLFMSPLLHSLSAEGVTGIPGITGLSFFETFTIMYAPPLIIVAAVAFLFIYLAKCQNPKD
ncbi:cytochrome bd oxidase small subunit CydS [Paenibacillus sp. QZ-Y1]|uniref:cytochrome bd oxidase small subunit CydS n=1 Tax=Paenibacillus sp. QZ-Y1 TaxID=3414511 RepID=UPI003F796E04